MRDRMFPDPEVSGHGMARAVVLAVSVMAALFLTGALFAPVATGAGSAAGWVLQIVYSPVCHQMPERSVPLAGDVMAVCARCTGLYVGGILGLIAGAAGLAWARRAPVWLLVAAAAPTVLDAMVSFAGFAGLSNIPRLVLAVPTGAVCGWFLAVGVGDLAGSLSRRESGRRAET